MGASKRKEERATLEIIAGSYETRDEREEQIWRAFIDWFVQQHDWHDLFTFDEVISAYREYLYALIHLAKASITGHVEDF